MGARSGGGGSSGGGAPNADQLLASLGSQRVNNIFTHLRKVAQHPLLIRSLYTEQQVGGKGRTKEREGKGERDCSYVGCLCLYMDKQVMGNWEAEGEGDVRGSCMRCSSPTCTQSSR